jgi:hypothetical protein
LAVFGGGDFGRGGVHAGFGHGRGFGGDRLPGFTRVPGRLPPIVGLPPHHIPPILIRPPHRFPPVIVRIPPRFHPPVIVRVPPRILPPPVIIGRMPLPVVVGGRSVAVDRDVRPVAAMASPAGCATDGSFVFIVFVPTATAADITAFLKSYNVTMADGPNVDGVYRIRLSTAVLPQNKVLKMIDSMRSQTEIVTSIDGA